MLCWGLKNGGVAIPTKGSSEMMWQQTDAGKNVLYIGIILESLDGIKGPDYYAMLM